MNASDFASLLSNAEGVHAPWLGAVLDEIDYGIVVLTPRLELAYCNRIGRSELNGGSPVTLLNGGLHAGESREDRQLREALRLAAERGLRRLLAFHRDEGTLTMAIVPMGGRDDRPTGQPAPVLVIFGRRQMCETLSAQALAKCFGLTEAEGRILAQLVAQQRPAEIAARLCVALCTVRTHIANIRVKAGVSSIRELVQMMARLPPLTNRLLS